MTVKIPSQKKFTTSVLKKKDPPSFNANNTRSPNPPAPLAQNTDSTPPHEHIDISAEHTTQNAQTTSLPPTLPAETPIANPFGPLALPASVVGHGFFPRDYQVRLKLDVQSTCVSIKSVLEFAHADPKPYLDRLVKKAFEKQALSLHCIAPAQLGIAKSTPQTDIMQIDTIVLTLRFFE